MLLKHSFALILRKLELLLSTVKNILEKSVNRSKNKRSPANKIQKSPQKPLGTEDQGQSENTNAESADGTHLPSTTVPNQEPTKSQGEHSKTKIKAYFKSFARFLIKPKTLIEIAALVVVICYTRYAGQQAKTMSDTLIEIRQQTGSAKTSADAAKSAAETASDALTSVQRAIVSFRTLTNKNILDPANKSITGVEFKARYENTGMTPTRGARHRIGYKDFVKGMPDNFNFRLDGRRLIDTVFSFSPKTTINAGYVTVPQELLDRIRADKTHLYFWGWLEYGDIFRGTPIHITMFCVELTDITDITHTNPLQSISQMGYTNCPKHNCEDEDCDGQPYGDGRIWHAAKK